MQNSNAFVFIVTTLVLCCIAGAALGAVFQWVGGDGDWDDLLHWCELPAPECECTTLDCYPNDRGDDAIIVGSSTQRIVYLVKVGESDISIDDLNLKKNVTFRDADGNDPTLNTESIVITGRLSGADVVILFEEDITVKADAA